MIDHHWPDEPWSLFSAWSPDRSSPTWCSLQWLRGNTYLDAGVLAEQFKRAGDEIINHLKCKPSLLHPDALFMPIAYLYRHALELKLKDLVGLACDAGLIERSNRVEEALEKHHLRRLWNPVRRAIVARWPNEPDVHVIDNTEALIRDFDRIDESGQNLRYTHDLNGQPTSVNYPEGVDLEAFKEAFSGVFHLLDGCSADFTEIVDWKREAEREGP